MILYNKIGSCIQTHCIPTWSRRNLIGPTGGGGGAGGISDNRKRTGKVYAFYDTCSGFTRFSVQAATCENGPKRGKIVHNYIDQLSSDSSDKIMTCVNIN